MPCISHEKKATKFPTTPLSILGSPRSLQLQDYADWGKHGSRKHKASLKSHNKQKYILIVMINTIKLMNALNPFHAYANSFS